MNKYLIYYIDSVRLRTGFKLVTESEVFEIIDEAKKDNKNLVVLTLGECVLDWS